MLRCSVEAERTVSLGQEYACRNARQHGRSTPRTWRNRCSAANGAKVPLNEPAHAGARCAQDWNLWWPAR